MKNKKGFSAIWLWLLVPLAIILGIVANAYAPVIQQYFNQQRAAEDITDRVTDGDYAQQQYEWFKTQKQKIEAMQNKIENQRQSIKTFKQTYGKPSTWTRDVRQDYSRKTTRLLGYKNQYQNLVAEYNAKMNMETRNLYKDKLPLEMEKKFWTGDLIP